MLQLLPDLICTDVHHNDIRANLYDLIPSDHIFTITADHTEPSSMSPDDQCTDLSGTFIKFQIIYIAQTSAVTDIDDLFFPEFT